MMVFKVSGSFFGGFASFRGVFSRLKAFHIKVLRKYYIQPVPHNYLKGLYIVIHLTCTKYIPIVSMLEIVKTKKKRPVVTECSTYITKTLNVTRQRTKHIISEK